MILCTVWKCNMPPEKDADGRFGRGTEKIHEKIWLGLLHRRDVMRSGLRFNGITEATKADNLTPTLDHTQRAFEGRVFNLWPKYRKLRFLVKQDDDEIKTFTHCQFSCSFLDFLAEWLPTRACSSMHGVQATEDRS